jgi:RNA polymerase sigma-70 factor (ECF subfamily)
LGTHRLHLVQKERAVSPVDAPTDDALVRRAQRDDREALGLLYERFYPLVHGVLLAHAHRDDVADLAHDVFFRAIEKLETLREPAAFGGWLAELARNAARMRHRRERRFVPLDDSVAVAAPALDSVDAHKALAALRSLPRAYRETLALRLVEGMTGPEIAERLGMTHGSVRVNLSKGMAMLRRALGESK